MQKAKKSLGQNFLINDEVLLKIAEAAEVKEGETVVEIGPGHGELTHFLIEAGAKVTAIEKDARLAKELAGRKIKNFEIIEGDALEALPKLSEKLKSYKLIGNIPYYITGYLFRILSELKNKPQLVVLTIQKEVAERICAEEGRMNILAASVQIWAETEIVAIVEKNNFDPPPKVDSAIIKVVTRGNRPQHLEKYYERLHTIFRQPRKTTLNNLKDGLKREAITESESKKIIDILSPGENSRPQDLSLSDLNKLASTE